MALLTEYLFQAEEGDGSENNDNEDDGDGDDDDEDSDDDGFKITIDKDKIEEAKTSYQTFGLNKPSARPAPTEKKGKFSVDEFDQLGSINGQVSVEYDLESIEDKPWRQPGILNFFTFMQWWRRRGRVLAYGDCGPGFDPSVTSILFLLQFLRESHGSLELFCKKGVKLSQNI